MTTRGMDAAPRVVDRWHTAGRADLAEDLLYLAAYMRADERAPWEIADAMISYCEWVKDLADVDHPPVQEGQQS